VPSLPLVILDHQLRPADHKFSKLKAGTVWTFRLKTRVQRDRLVSSFLAPLPCKSYGVILASPQRKQDIKISWIDNVRLRVVSEARQETRQAIAAKARQESMTALQEHMRGNGLQRHCEVVGHQESQRLTSWTIRKQMVVGAGRFEKERVSAYIELIVLLRIKSNSPLHPTSRPSHWSMEEPWSRIPHPS